jgi:hypothetical protein
MATDMEVAETPVMAVTVVVVMAVVVMAVVMTMAMTVAMTTAVPAAGRRVACGGERGNRQRHSGDSGSKDSTLHFNFSWGWSRATIAPGYAS